MIEVIFGDWSHATSLPNSSHAESELGHLTLLLCASVSKRVFLQSLSCENDFDLHESESAGIHTYHIHNCQGI